MSTGPDESPDPDELRAAVRERWERSADGWQRRNARFQEAAMPVSHWMVEAIAPQPGQRVLELAAGVGETGFLAAELVAPGGTLISSDGAEAMLAHARARAAELGLANVEFKPLELEWIDLPAASVDAVLCRWGLMFALDRGAALREMRRVLKPGGRLALAVWTAPQRNPFAAVPRGVLVDAGLVDGFELGASGPTMFDLADSDALRELLDDAGFADPVIDEVTIGNRYDDVEDLIATTCDLSPAFADVVTPLNERQRADLVERLAVATAPFSTPDGSISLPGVALVAAADA